MLRLGAHLTVSDWKVRFLYRSLDTTQVQHAVLAYGCPLMAVQCKVRQWPGLVTEVHRPHFYTVASSNTKFTPYVTSFSPGIALAAHLTGSAKPDATKIALGGLPSFCAYQPM